MKSCSKCKIAQPFYSFSKKKASSDGYKSHCKTCDKVLREENKFKPGMAWGNHSKDGWHIDHIVPLASFDLSDPDQVKQACHYSNLQPLWTEENLQKSDKCA